MLALRGSVEDDLGPGPGRKLGTVAAPGLGTPRGPCSRLFPRRGQGPPRARDQHALSPRPLHTRTLLYCGYCNERVCLSSGDSGGIRDKGRCVRECASECEWAPACGNRPRGERESVRRGVGAGMRVRKESNAITMSPTWATSPPGPGAHAASRGCPGPVLSGSVPITSATATT